MLVPRLDTPRGARPTSVAVMCGRRATNAGPRGPGRTALFARAWDGRDSTARHARRALRLGMGGKGGGGERVGESTGRERCGAVPRPHARGHISLWGPGNVNHELSPTSQPDRRRRVARRPTRRINLDRLSSSGAGAPRTAAPPGQSNRLQPNRSGKASGSAPTTPHVSGWAREKGKKAGRAVGAEGLPMQVDGTAGPDQGWGTWPAPYRSFSLLAHTAFLCSIRSGAAHVTAAV